MSLYISITSKPKARKTPALFYAQEDSLLCYHGREENLVSENNLNAKDIFEYAEEHGFIQFEIRYDASNEREFPTFLESLADYLIDKDLSVGLLLGSPSLIRRHWTLIKELGIATSWNPPVMETGSVCRGPLMGMLFKASPEPRTEPRRLRRFAMGIPPYRGQELKEDFNSMLVRLLNESKMSNVEVYQRGGISKQVFSKILSTPGMIPTKSTVFCLAIGMKLSIETTIELLEAAGYALSKSLIGDVIVGSHIQDEDYDLLSINSDLDEYGCPLLGWRPRE